MNYPHLEIHLDRLTANIHAVQQGLDPKTELIFIVKSEAYGHGLARVAERAAASGVKWFGVAYLHEARVLRPMAPDAHILLMGALDPRDVDEAIDLKVTPLIISSDHANRLSEAVGPQRLLDVHLKVDTGMGRLGLTAEEFAQHAENLLKVPGLSWQGICSHFATVEPGRPELAEAQYQLFDAMAKQASTLLGRRLMRHISSSRAVQFHREWDLDGIRPGIILYGYGSQEAGMRVQTEPWLEWKSQLIQVKSVPADFSVGYYSSYRTPGPTDIGVVSVGYADGYLRSLSNRGFALVHGCRCPVVGRISMNWVTLDLGPESGCRAGDEVVLMGTQGEESIWADELARSAGTIAYEILTAIHPLTERVYVEQKKL